MSGYIGYRKVPTLSDGGGIWRLNEQAKFRKEGVWPVLDPYWSNVVLLLPMDSNFNDVSSSPKTMTVVGSAINTSTKKFGAGSSYFDGSGDYLTTATSISSFHFVDANGFSVECWVYASSWSNWSNVTNGWPCLLGNMNPTGTSNYWSFGPTATGALQFHYYNGASQYITTTEILSTSAWVHIAFKYYGGNIILYIDGSAVKTTAISGTPWVSSDIFCIGSYNNVSITGYVDDIRITKGANRTIVVPNDAYPQR